MPSVTQCCKRVSQVFSVHRKSRDSISIVASVCRSETVGKCHVEKVSHELHLTQAGTLTGECWGGRRPRLCGCWQKGLTQGWLLAWAFRLGVKAGDYSQP